MIWRVLLTLLAGYLLGNLNGSILTSNREYRDDVRDHGSGNAGMTNFMRTYGTSKLLRVIVIDMGKSALACFIGWLLLRGVGYGEEGKMIGGVAALLGHAFPVFFGFRGGKGVLSACAVALCVHWWSLLLVLAVFFVLLLTTHYMSLASLTAVALWCIMAQYFFWSKWVIMGCAIFVGVLITFLHRSNIARLLQGTERKTYLHRTSH